MLISIDHGNKQIKLTGKRFFTSGLRESDSRPPIGENFLKYKGKYYALSEKRIPYMRNKTDDNRFYILTLFAIAFGIEDTGQYKNDLMHINLLVGLPPAHYGGQYEQFQSYFVSKEIEEFEFRNKQFKIFVDEVAVYPQAYAAAVTVFSRISSFPKVVIIDIGGFSVDYLSIKNGESDFSDCDSLENGVITLYNQIVARVNSDLNILLDESDIDAILKGDTENYSVDVRLIVNNSAQVFVSDLVGKLRERSIDLRSGKAVFVGGGSILLRNQIEASDKISSTIFVESISANAKGYEILHRASKVSD